MIHGPAKIIDPQTGKVKGYQDPVSRQIFESWPPPPGTSKEVVYYDFYERSLRNYPKLSPNQKRMLSKYDERDTI